MPDLPPLPREVLDLIITHVPREVYSLIYVFRGQRPLSHKQTRVLATSYDLRAANGASAALMKLEAAKMTSLERQGVGWGALSLQDKKKVFCYRRPLKIRKHTDEDDCDSWSITGRITEGFASFSVVKQKLYGDTFSAEELQERREADSEVWQRYGDAEFYKE